MLFNLTVEGRIATEPTTITTDNGHTRLTFRLLHTSQHYNREARMWVDDDTIGLDVTAWNRTAVNAAGLRKGDLVVVTFQPRLDTRVGANGKAYMRATADTISLSGRFDPLTSNRRSATAAATARTGDTVRTADGELVSA